MTQKHTPILSWNGNELVDSQGKSVAGITPEQPDYFAEEIRARYNAHDELVAALEMLCRVYHKGDFETEFKPALERAEAALVLHAGRHSHDQ